MCLCYLEKPTFSPCPYLIQVFQLLFIGNCLFDRRFKDYEFSSLKKGELETEIAIEIHYSTE